MERGGEEAQKPRPHREMKQHKPPRKLLRDFWELCLKLEKLFMPKTKLEWGFLVLNLTERIQLPARNTQLKLICRLQARSSSQRLLQSFSSSFQNLHFLPRKCYFSSTLTSLTDNAARYRQQVLPRLILLHLSE